MTPKSKMRILEAKQGEAVELAAIQVAAVPTQPLVLQPCKARFSA